jgi:hypothetical protein
LYKTCIGNGALGSLGPWLARGYAHELHFSDLAGHVTTSGVNAMLSEIHRGGQYPYRDASGGTAALWLRLEHNGLTDVDGIVSKCKAKGHSVRIIEKPDIAWVRPGQAIKKNHAVHLVLFRIQDRRVQPMSPPPKQAVSSSPSKERKPTASASDKAGVTTASKSYNSPAAKDKSYHASEDSRWVVKQPSPKASPKDAPHASPKSFLANNSLPTGKWEASQSQRRKQQRDSGSFLSTQAGTAHHASSAWWGGDYGDTGGTSAGGYMCDSGGCGAASGLDFQESREKKGKNKIPQQPSTIIFQ